MGFKFLKLFPNLRCFEAFSNQTIDLFCTDKKNFLWPLNLLLLFWFLGRGNLLISKPEYSGWLSSGSSAQYRLVLAPISADNMNMLLSFPAALVINSGNKSEYYGLVGSNIFQNWLIKPAIFLPRSVLTPPGCNENTLMLLPETIISIWTSKIMNHF